MEEVVCPSCGTENAFDTEDIFRMVWVEEFDGDGIICDDCGAVLYLEVAENGEWTASCQSRANL